jgi:hypothetical protein
MAEVRQFKRLLTLGQPSKQLQPHKWTLQWSRCQEGWASYEREELLQVYSCDSCLRHLLLLFFFCCRVLCLPLIMKQICSAGMLDHIMVETADIKFALNRIAVVSVLDAHTLSVMPYDPSVRTSLALQCCIKLLIWRAWACHFYLLEYLYDEIKWVALLQRESKQNSWK